MARGRSGDAATTRATGESAGSPGADDREPGAAATPRRAGRKVKAAETARTATVKAATPWGPAAVVEEVRVAQRAGDKRFASIVQLLEDPRGEALVRIAYTTDGVARRGPVTLRLKDLERLRAAAGGSERLATALGWQGGDA